MLQRKAGIIANWGISTSLFAALTSFSAALPYVLWINVLPYNKSTSIYFLYKRLKVILLQPMVDEFYSISFYNLQSMYDRRRKNELPEMQLGFIDGVCLPIYQVSITGVIL